MPVEPPAEVTITGTILAGGGFALAWEGAAGVSYQVQRADSVDGTFADISGAITESQFTDANPPTEAAFYRVVVLPE